MAQSLDFATKIHILFHTASRISLRSVKNLCVIAEFTNFAISKPIISQQYIYD